MATAVFESDEPVSVSLPGVEFDLKEGQTYETDDPRLAAELRAVPALKEVGVDEGSPPEPPTETPSPQSTAETTPSAEFDFPRSDS